MGDLIYERRRNFPVNYDAGNEDNTELLPPPFDGDGIPVNWCKVRDSQQEPYILVQLQPGQLEYDKILEDFSTENIKVAKVERLQNMKQLHIFKSELEEIKTTHSQDFNPNIRYLYHGTCVEKTRICEEGLDQRLSRMGHFGKGIYFSDSPMKCLYCTEFVNQPERAMVLKCRVILGNCKTFEPGHFDTNLTSEPKKENHVGGYRYYDSVMGCPTDFNEYIVYENRRVMVEYVISFEAGEEMKKSIEPMPSAHSPVEEGDKKTASSGNALKYVALCLGVGAVGFVATPLIAIPVLGAVGFTSAGVAAGSIAATIQAAIGNVAAGSLFAMAQSAGATGVVSVATQLAGGTLAGTVAGVSAAVNKWRKVEPTEEKKSDKKE